MGTHSLLGFLLLITLISLTNAGFVKKILRHKRQTLSPPSEHNVTFPSADHPVVFSHVYNINVPESSLCSVDLESPEGAHVHSKDIAAVPQGHHVTEHTFNGENQILFTHRINIPRQACGCKDDFPGLKELMSRLEMLEGEVSALRDQCSSEQLTGELGTKPYCNGHGKYSTETCACICDPGWRGPNCTEGECPTSCQDRGRCVDGKCECYKGFTGEDCALKTCPMDCGAHGICEREVCVCSDGFFGEDCSESRCLNNCLGRGRCDEGDCICDEPWTGLDCSELICPNDCYDRGRCVNGTCYCDEGFSGEDCADFSCPNNCRGNGFCVDGKCICTVGYSGQDCSQLTCLNDCNDRGRCFNGVCICDSGYQGEDCSQVACVNNCHNRGQCINGRCSCDAGFHGDDCSELSCPNNCQLKGRCVNGQCVCDEGFAGEDCSIHTCPSNCYGRGECIEGRCACHVGYVGEDCSQLSCPNNCNNRGRCIDGQCVCDEGFSGEDCSQKACLNDCLARGYCIDGKCFCHEGYTGESCSILACPENCNNRGRCVNGRCTCDSGYEGESCADLSCINNCQDKGRCVNGQCFCDEGYIGEDCSEVSPPKDLTVGEVSTETVDLSWNNEMLVTEYLITYVPTSPGGLLMEFTVPGDKNAATVKELEPGIEYLISVYAVLSNKRSIPVSARVATDLPQPEGVRFKSVRETSVEVVWDQLDISFDSWEIYFRNTKEENGKVVSTLPPSQNEFLQSGLGPGQEYEVSINVVKNNTRGPQTSRTVTTKIDGPRQVEVKDVTDSSALISWYLPVAPADGVTIFYMPSSNHSDETTVDVSPSDKQYSIDNLKPDTEYAVSIISRHKEATSDPVTTIFTTELDAPTAAQAVSQTDDSITLEWTNSQADVSSYRVKYTPISGSSHGERVFPRGSGRTTQATITGLKPGTEYGVGVTAVKHERESLPATTNAATELDPPRDFKQIRSTETSLSVSWQKPQAKLSGYRLEYMSRDGQAEQVDIPASANTFVLSDLIPGMSYTMTLTAERGHKRSRPVSLTASTAGLEPTLGNLIISDITWDSFVASWNPTGEDFNSFVIEVTNMDDLAEAQNLTLSGDATSLLISGLNPNTSYMVGLYGTHQGSFLEPLYSEATTVIQPVVGKLFASNFTPESFTIHWNNTEKLFDGFVLEIIDSDWLMELMEYNISRNVTSKDVTGLRPSTDYIAYLYGTYKGSRTGAVSTVASTAEEPDLSKLVVSNITSDRFSLSWRTGEKEFDTFIVEVRESALPSQAMGRTLPGDARSTVMAGLRANTSYNIKLYASEGGRQSTQPLLAVATTEEVPLLGPIFASSANPHYLSLHWNTLSGSFDGFVLQVSDSEQQSDTLEFRLPGEARNFTIPNLMDDTGYDIELYGISHGRRTPSVYVHALTAPLPKVENLTISNVTPYGFRVSWEVKQHPLHQEDISPSGGGFSHFHIVVTDSGWLLEPQEFTVPGDQSHLDIWGLITGIGYEVKLTGVSESGLLSRPLTTVAVTEAEPEVEHLFISDITSHSFRLSWAADEDQFDRFVIKIRDSKRLAHPREYKARGSERTKVITGLMSGTEYEIELYGLTLDQRSQPITAVAQTGLSAPKGLHFTEVTDSSAVVHWSNPRSQVDSYRITYVPFEGGSPLILNADGSMSEMLLINMFPGKTYQVTVSSLKGLEESEPSTGTVTTALDSPRGVTAVNVTDTSALLSWQPSVATVDGYVITYSTDTVSPVVEHVSGNIVEFQINTLVPGSHYTAAVYGVKEAQRSESTLTAFTTDLDPPRDLMANNVQTDTATLTWKPPTAAVTGYMLSFSSPGGVIREVMLSPTASSYSMSQLTGSTKYDVRLQAISGAQRSRYVTTTFSTNKVGQLYARPWDCAQILLNGETTSGLYTIYIGGEESQPIQVYCDMTTDGGGWMVFLRRQNGKLEFFRNWKNYTAGFGNMNDEFWLGLSSLHKITSLGHYELRVDLRDNEESAYAQYDKFTIAEPRTRYKVYLGAYSGTAGDSMSYHQGRPFSTYDNDNDIAVTNCALSYKGAFWYKNCHRVNLMGKYGDSSHSKGINWFHWKGHEHSIEFAEMKIRPANFKNPESRKKSS
ncbi:PREDICTED: tenascin-like isoform X3 [Cyprinodon variegatus]|uniref:Tenascin C n=1 Tax=Cyprinodon variegatus TaxID=28743 RepID=A0A3Q2C9U6_CYPVA|nr:PREDICTED: tenascin-like isoform X3 [Cyprinodon variegatus]